MARGRCAGCGFESPSARRVVIHTMECVEYLALFRTRPEACLPPEQEAERWRLYQESDEGQAAKEQYVEARNLGYKQIGDHKTEAHKMRWSPTNVKAYLTLHSQVKLVPMPMDGRLNIQNLADPAFRIVQMCAEKQDIG